MLNDGSFVIAVAVLAATAFATRLAGVVLMAWVPPGPRVERFLEGLAVSVIAALVASALVTADIKTVAAILVAIALMALTRSIIWAMLAGMVAAATYPLVMSF